MEWNRKNSEGVVEKDIRKAYYGGLSEVQKGFVENGYYYDMNSQYPNAMLKNEFPVGNPNSSSDNELKNSFGFFMLKLKHLNFSYVPRLPIKKDGKLITPLGEFEGWYLSEELKFAEKNGRTVLGGSKFTEKRKIFNEYVNDFYKDKELATIEKNNVMKQFYKSMLNCLYGRFGIKEINDKVEIVNKDKLNLILNNHNRMYIEEFNDNSFFIKYDMNKNKILNHNGNLEFKFYSFFY